MNANLLKSFILFGSLLSTGIFAQTSLEEIISDMSLPHEGRPHGVPSGYDWASKPRPGLVEPPADWSAAIAWGQVYEWIEGNPASNTRVQLKDLELYYLSKIDHKWHLLQKSVRVDGNAYVEDFKDDVNKPADKRLEPDGSISITCGDGYNFHFWPSSGRVKFPVNEVAGCFVTIKARLILDDPLGVDDRDSARYVLSVGGDWWLSLTAAWDQFKTNADMGIGRFRFVTPEWRSFNMFSVPADTLLNNPPPFTSTATSLKMPAEVLPEKMVLMQNFPNPFSSLTRISYFLTEKGATRLSVFDMEGRLIRNLADNYSDRGPYLVQWDASDLTEGSYLIRLENNGISETIKCMLIK